MRSLVVAALLGVTAAADDHCAVTQKSYTTKDCTGTATDKDWSKLYGTVKDTCTKTGETTNKGSKMSECTSTSYKYQLYTDETCTDANKVATDGAKTFTLSDTTCTKVSDTSSTKMVWVPKATGAKAVAGAAWALVATAMLVTQV